MDFGITYMSTERMDEKDIRTLNPQEQKNIRLALSEIVGGEELFDEGKYTQSVFRNHYTIETGSREGEKISQVVRYVKFHSELLLVSFDTFLSQDKKTSFVQITQLDIEKEQKTVLIYHNGELFQKGTIESELKSLDLPDSYGDDVLNLPNQEGEVGVQSDDTGIECIWDGCCAFRKYGLPWNPKVVYKWCGNNCGSGTPVNQLDRFCRAHDLCYRKKENSSYPARCNCDAILIAGASGSDDAGASRVSAAIQAKAVAAGCAF
jgi:hypothetical protein